MSKVGGYLVVLKHAEYPKWITNPPNPGYRGLDRLPGSEAEHEEEREALDLVLFDSSYNDERGFTPLLTKARELLSRLAPSPREFELIYARPHELSRGVLQKANLVFLGFDVAGPKGPFWSVVKEFPEAAEVEDYLNKLNNNGLFDSAGDAKAYLKAYKARKLHDWQDPLTIWEVYLAK